MAYNPKTWTEGTVVKPARVVIDGVEHEVLPEERTGANPLTPDDMNNISDTLHEHDNSINNLNRYSIEETFTGKYWIDGKKIYRKVVDLGTLVNADSKLITSGISEQIYPIKIYGFAIKSIEMFPLPFIWGGTSAIDSYCGLFYDRENNQFYFRTNRDMSTYTGIGILEYTKTTD